MDFLRRPEVIEMVDVGARGTSLVSSSYMRPTALCRRFDLPMASDAPCRWRSRRTHAGNHNIGHHEPPGVSRIG